MYNILTKSVTYIHTYIYPEGFKSFLYSALIVNLALMKFVQIKSIDALNLHLFTTEATLWTIQA